MKNKTAARLLLILLILGIPSLSFNVRVGKASGTIYILEDGSVDPPTAPIQRIGDLYTLSADIYDSIIVRRSNIILDGNHFKLQGTGTGTGVYTDWAAVFDVAVRNMMITGFGTGIYINYGVIENNVIANNALGVSLEHSLLIRNNVISNNSVAGIRLLWSGATISGNTLAGNGHAIDYLYSQGNNWINNTIIKNTIGIGGIGSQWLSVSNITGNEISSNLEIGIVMHDATVVNFSNNEIKHNGVGVFLTAEMSTTNNKIVGNTIAYNDFGLEIGRYSAFGSAWGVTNNFIYHNSFLSNAQQNAFVNGTTSQLNYWDNGYPSGGNFWSDYAGVDLYSGPGQNLTGSDGIGDTTYVIAQNNVDRYPFRITTIIINPDGLIHPSIAPIYRDGNLYTLTSDIYSGIVIYRSDIIVDGNNFKLQGTGTGTGFYLPHAYSNVTIRNTVIKRFSTGIATQDTSNSAIKNCVISNNSVGISLNDSPGITVSGNVLSNNTDAIRYWYGVYYGPQNWVNNTITNNNNGIIGWGLITVNIMNNIISNNTGTGIRVQAGYSNVISHNNIEHNNRGIHFFSQMDPATNNIITDNTIAYNSIGVQIDPGDVATMRPLITDNSFYHNNFIYNTQQTYAPLEDVVPQPNSWDNGYPPGGNFWSDYNGVDLYNGPGQNITGGDGIGDAPYVVAQENVDRYPLMTPYGTTEFFVLRITTTTGGTTNPATGPYVYTSGTTVEVTAVPEGDYVLDYWELDNINGGVTNPISVVMKANHALKAIFRPRPDIAVTSVVPYPTSVRLGQLVYINVTVENQRFTSETFDVVVYADSDRKTIGDEIVVGVQAVHNLLPGGTKTITFIWDTSTLPSGTAYYISAKAIVPYDVDSSNNLLTAKKKVAIRH